MQLIKIYLRCISISFFLLSWNELMWCQPFVDLFQVRYMSGYQNDFTHLWVGSDLPIKLKEKTYLLLSPSYERWEPYPYKDTVVVQGLSLPIVLIVPVHHSNFSFACTVVPRWNGLKLFDENTFQFGGAALVIYKLKPKQKFRLGIYANTEFFGLFIVPLVGVDWELNESNYLFGTLPGRLTYEHRFGKKFYGGFTFRAITNSYSLSNDQYVRLEDNQLSAFLDYYMAKNICFTLEPGYAIFRKLREGQEKKIYLRELDWSDEFFIKLSAAYRLRLQ